MGLRHPLRQSAGAKRIEKDSGIVVGGATYVWSDNTVVEERALDTNVVVRRLEGAGEQQNGVSFFYAKDHLGSATEVVDATGVLRGRYAYDPFGRQSVIAGDVASGSNFTGHQYHAESGLLLTLYRAYSSEYGRWLSRDPLGMRASPNAYGYVENQPTRLVDPFGLASVQMTNCDDKQRGKIESAYTGICGAVAQPNGRSRQILSQNNLLDGMQKQCNDGIKVECTKEFTCGRVHASSVLQRAGTDSPVGNGHRGGRPMRRRTGAARRRTRANARSRDGARGGCRHRHGSKLPAARAK